MQKTPEMRTCKNRALTALVSVVFILKHDPKGDFRDSEIEQKKSQNQHLDNLDSNFIPFLFEDVSN